MQRKCITDAININMNDSQWTQATLSVEDGGLGSVNVLALPPSWHRLQTHYESRTTSNL